MLNNCRLVRFEIFNIVYSVSELWTVLVVGLVPLVFVFAIWNLSKCANRVSCNAALQAATIRIRRGLRASGRVELWSDPSSKSIPHLLQSLGRGIYPLPNRSPLAGAARLLAGWS